MEVTLASRSHLLGVSQVLHAALYDTFSGMLRPETIGNMMSERYSPSTLKRALMKGELFVAIDDEHVVGCSMAERRNDHLDVEILAIDPGHRMQGSGRRLLERVQELDPELPMAIVLLLGGMEGESFLEALGFVPGEVVEQHLGGEPTVGRRWWRAPDSLPGR